MANDLVPFYEDGDELPCVVAGSNVTGCKCVQIMGARTSGPGLSQTSEGSRYVVGHPNAAGAPATAGAAKSVLGVASWDAVVGAPVTVKRGAVLPVFAGGAIAPGAEVEVAADGSVVTLAAGKAVGMALNTGVNAQICEVLMYL